MKTKRGRPKKKKSELRNKKVTVCFTEPEYKGLCAAAKKHDCAPSALLLMLARRESNG